MDEASTETLEMIINMITEAGMDYHNFKCAIIASRVEWDREHGYETNLWEEIAEFPSRECADADRAWELAAVPNPYLEEAA